MVIACKECQTRFHVEDARIPREGIRVRCSRCKHAFFVQPPGASPEDLFDAAAEQGLRDEVDDAPPPTRDLGDAGDSDSGNPFGPPGAQLAPSAAKAGSAEPEVDAEETGRPAAVGSEADEEDWQFAIEPPEPARERRAPPSPAPESDPVRTLPPLGAAASSAADSDADAAQPESSSLADLDSPESWNLVGSEESEAPPPEQHAESVATPKREARRRAESPKPSPVAASPRSVGRPRESSPVTALANGLAMAAAALLFVAGLHGAVAGGVTSPRTPAAAVGLGPLSASRVEARTIENAWVGPITVVRMQAETSGSHAQPPGQIVRVVAVDTTGAPLPISAAAGRDPGDTPLREEDPARIANLLERSAEDFARRPLGPGQSVALVAVFPSLPANASGFSLETAPVSGSRP